MRGTPPRDRENLPVGRTSGAIIGSGVHIGGSDHPRSSATLLSVSDPSLMLDAQRNDDSFEDVWEELLWRGLVHVSTDRVELKSLLAGPPITYYCGFDPTAKSLHLGNLVQLLLMRRLQLAGHSPLGLVGGSTGLIGDPRPSAERVLNTKETVLEWVGSLQGQVSRYLDQRGSNGLRMVNNLDWTGALSAIDFLRDVGKYFRVGTMIKKDAVSTRLNSTEGISFTEFSYQVLQGLDFLQLYRDYGCVLQTGGSDQWGNLTSGTDLIHKAEGVSAHAIGTPLITNSDGTKFGKSEGNAVWLDASMTSPYAFYQFWLNSDDADVINRLRVFTFLSRAEIDRLATCVAEIPHAREAQRALAFDMTCLVHGERAARETIAAAEALFGQGDLGEVDRSALRAALVGLPNTSAPLRTTVVQVLLDTGLTSTVGEAKRAIAQGGVYLNNERVADDSATLAGHVLAGGLVVLRRGKRTLAGVFVTENPGDTPGLQA